jgi:sugar phosphate isomerase/epimerase
MALGPTDLVLSWMAMTRVEPPWKEIGASFEERCVAAEAGGFAGIGLVPLVYDEALEAGHSHAEVMAMLSDRGLVIGEVEVPATLPGRAGRSEFEPILEHALEVAELIGAERVFVVTGPGLDEEEATDAFGWACDRCAAHNLPATIEFVPIPAITSVHDARMALRVVRAADRPNGGITVDSNHHFNGPNDWEALEAIPGELVGAIQFNDTKVPRDDSGWVEGTPHQRRAPGEGDADVVRFVQTMDAIGADVPYSLEVISDEIVALAPVQLGERLGGAARSVFASARKA